MKTKTSRKIIPRITETSGNVFADLGLPNPEQELMKARLTLQIYRIIKEQDLTQTEAAKILGIKQPHVSLLMRNRAGSFSVGRLTWKSPSGRHERLTANSRLRFDDDRTVGGGGWRGSLRNRRWDSSANRRTASGNCR